MATITGQSLVDAIQASTGVTLNPLLQATLAARLQQQLDTGTYSPLAAAVAIQGFSTEIKAVVDANGGSTAFSTHLTEVAAAIQNDTPVPEFVPEADQTFALTAGAAAVDEGATATFTLTTTGVAEGTAVAYTLSGIDAADLASGALTGNAVVGADGTATISVALAADTLTEGAETLTVTLDGKAVTASTTVNDTSTTPVAVFALTASAASADEGTSVTLSIANGTPNTEYAIQISGVEDADITGAKVRVVTTDASGNASVNVAIVADRLTEGAQTLTAHIVGQPAVVASVVVNDTSLDNTAPAITAAADLAATEDTAANFAATAVDAEGDVVTLAATAANGAVVKNADGSFTYTGSKDFVGADTITVTANDGTVDTVQTIAVTVANVNDAPVVTVPATLAADEETAANFAVSTSDVDGDTVTVTATAANGAVVKNADGSFTYTGSKDFVGADTITVTANDGTVDTVQTIAVTVANVNDAPVVTVPATLAADEETAANFAVSTSDVDGDTVTVTATAANGAVVKNADGSFTYTGSKDFVGADTITVTANDGTVDTVQTIAVTVANVNDAPVVTVPATLAADEETAANFAVSTSDVDGDTVTVTATAANGAVVKNADGSFTYTGSKDFVGADTITVTANDGTVDTVQTIAVTVANVNDAPVAAAVVAPVAAEEGAAVTVNLAGSDVDTGDTLTYAVEAVEGLTFDAATGAYSFDPTLNNEVKALTYTSADWTKTVNYTVTDAAGATATNTLTLTATPKPLSFTLVPSASYVEEGQTISYKLVASEAVQAVFNGSIQVTPGDGTAGQTAANDFGSGALNPQNVTIAVGQTESTLFNLIPQNDATTEVPESYTAKATVVGYTIADVTGQVRDPSTVGGTGQTFTLTTGIDTMPGLIGSANSAGTDGNDTIVATDKTLNALDDLDAGLGANVMRFDDTTGGAKIAATTVIKNVQTINVRSEGDVGATGASTFSTKNLVGVETLNITLGDAVFAEAATTTNVNVSGAQGAITIDGGKNVVVTDAAADNAIDIGGTTVNAGTVTVTDTKQGTGTIDVDGGTDLTITATTAADLTGVNSGTIKVGLDAGTPVAPTGAVKITQNLNATGGDADGDDLVGGAISVKGGKTVDITVNATSTATKAAADGDITIGKITVTGDSKTTDVTVTQNASVTTFTTPVVAETGATQTVTFKALATGETTALTHGANTLTFTAAKALTAEQVAQAFADLVNNDRQDNGGPTANGTYSGQFAAAWASTSVSGAVVTFTANADDTTTLVAAGGVAPTLGTLVAGVNGSGGVPTTNTVTLGDVDVLDNATEAIKTITLNAFGDATLGTGGSLDALTTLNLTNSAGDTVLTSTSKTLAVTLNDIDGGDVNLGANVETLTLTTTGAASNVDLKADGVKSLTIDAGVGLTLQSGANFDGALETVTVKGAGAVDLGDISAAVPGSGTLKSFSAADNTGGVTASISAKTADVASTFTKYVFSQGADTVTLVDANVDKAIELGAGNDTIALAATTTTLAASIDGGTGSNTLHMDAADAVNAAGATTFETKISNFQKLSLGYAAAAGTVDLANLDDISYVISANSGVAAPTKEVFTADFNTSGTIISHVGADAIAFDNSAPILLAAGSTPEQIATAVAGGIFTNWDAVDNTDGTVTFTAKNPGVVNPNVVAGAFTITDADSTTAAVAVSTTTEGTFTYTFDTTGLKLFSSLGGNDTFAIGNYTFTADDIGDDNVAEIAADINKSGVGTKISDVFYTATSFGANLILSTVDTTAPVSLTYTATDKAGNASFSAGNDSGAANSQANGDAEVFRADFTTSGAIEDADTIVFDDVTITLASGMTPAQIATAVAGQVYPNYTATNLGSNVVQFTQKTAGAVKNVIAGDFDITNELGATTAAKVTITVDEEGAAAGTAPTLTLDNMANNGTLELTAAGAGVNVIVTDAGEAGQTNNILNVIVSDALTAAGIDVGSVVVNDVETINVKANDAFTDDGVLGGTANDGLDDVNAAHTIDVDGDSVITINVDGAGDVTLTTTSTVLEAVNAANLTGKLTFSADLDGLTVTGGSGADQLEVNGSEVTINAGAGNDRIQVNAGANLLTVDGGTGTDTFVIMGAADNKDSYAVFENVGSGDTFDFNNLAVGDFRIAKVTLAQGATESSQAYLNQAIKDLAAGEMGWFQYNGNTFVVVDKSNTDAFDDGTDVAIMITGLVDLSTDATFNTTSNTLEII